jgi:hypothetical protein
LGPQLLQHAKDLVWTSVKPLLLLSKACLTNALSDPSKAIPQSMISVLGEPSFVCLISSFIRRNDLIISDPLEMCDKMVVACEEGDVETVIRLLDTGKSVDCVDDDGWTPVDVALRWGHLNIVIMLAGKGANLSTASGSFNVLHYAVLGGNCQYQLGAC